MDLALASLFASFLGPLDQVERIKEAVILIRGRAKLGYFVPTSHCLSAYLCCGSLGPLPHPTPQKSELVECLQRWRATNSCHPSRWRSGARGERVGCLPRSHCFWKLRACAPQLESRVLGPVLEFSLILPLGSSSDGVLVLDYLLLQPPSPPSPAPLLPTLPSSTYTQPSKGSVFQQGDPRLTDVLHFLLSEKEGLALPPPAVVV